MRSLLQSAGFSDWVSARIRQFYRWRHGTQCTRLLIVDQLMAFDRIAVVAATTRGHELGNWRILDGYASAQCVQCGREVVVYYSPIQPDMEGSLFRHGCKPVRRSS